MAGSVHVAYFDRFPNFEQNLQASFISEFHRLAISQGWRKHKKRYKDERIRCVREHYDAYLGQVERGGQEEKLVKLQGLCMELLVDPAQTITQCKKALSKVHVNIIDLIDARRRNVQVKTFKSYRALEEYTKDSTQFFPKEMAKTDGVLNVLLRTLLRKPRNR